MPDAQFKGFADAFGGERLGYAHNRHVSRFSSCPSRSLFHAFLNRRDVLRHTAGRCPHAADSSRVGRLLAKVRRRRAPCPEKPRHQPLHPTHREITATRFSSLALNVNVSMGDI